MRMRSAEGFASKKWVFVPLDVVKYFDFNSGIIMATGWDVKKGFREATVKDDILNYYMLHGSYLLTIVHTAGIGFGISGVMQ